MIDIVQVDHHRGILLFHALGQDVVAGKIVAQLHGRQHFLRLADLQGGDAVLGDEFCPLEQVVAGVRYLGKG